MTRPEHHVAEACHRQLLPARECPRLLEGRSGKRLDVEGWRGRDRGRSRSRKRRRGARRARPLAVSIGEELGQSRRHNLRASRRERVQQVSERRARRRLVKQAARGGAPTLKADGGSPAQRARPTTAPMPILIADLHCPKALRTKLKRRADPDGLVVCGRGGELELPALHAACIIAT